MNHIVEARKIEGVFRVKSITGKGVRLEVLDQNSGHYDISVPPSVKVAFEPGMLIIGSLLKERGWKLLGVERVFPAEAGVAATF